MFKTSVDTDIKDKHGLLCTESFVPNYDVLILLYSLKVLKCTGTSKCQNLLSSFVDY